jgi:methionyl-tRNA synthetase
MITMKDFEKIEMKIGEILAVKDIPKADKLYELEVDIGGKQITLVAGIKQHYERTELLGKKIAVVTNLEPVTIRGVESQGMLLAAIKEDKISLITVDKDIPVGSDVA